MKKTPRRLNLTGFGKPLQAPPLENPVFFGAYIVDQEHLSLLESINGERLKLVLAVMRDVGPACQTLGGLLQLTSSETFTRIENIAKISRLPLRTAEKHLAALCKGGWIENLGRKKSANGGPRRSCTLKITKKTLTALARKENQKGPLYGLLPWWANKMPWSARAVFSVIMTRLAGMKRVVEKSGTSPDYEQDIIDGIEKMRGEDRFRFSLQWLSEQTGLARKSITAAKKYLSDLGIVKWKNGTLTEDGKDADGLVPNWEFRVAVAVSCLTDEGP